MIYYVIILLFLISLALGFFLESIKINHPLWKCFVAGASALCAEIVVFALLIRVTLPWWKNQLTLLLKQRNPLFGSENIPMQVSDWIVWLFFALIAFLLLQAFLIAFNVRHTLKNPWFSLCGLFVFSGIYYVSFPWFFQGIGTFVVLLGKFESRFPTGKTLLASLLFTGGGICLWTLYSLCGKRSGIRFFLIQIGVYLGIGLVLWSGAFVTALPYANSQKEKAACRGIAPFRIESDLPMEAKAIRRKMDAFRKNHPAFALPFESVYDWQSNSSNANRIPADRREYTLKHFDTPEMAELLRKREELLGFFSNRAVLYMPLLGEVRSYARVRAGRAALFLETRQQEKILPELMKIIVIDRDILTDSPFIISELVRIACRSIWYTEMVKLGPDDQQYAPVYREALQFMKSRKIHLPDESGYYLGLFSGVKCGTYQELLAYPSVNAMLGKGLSRTLALAPKLAGQFQREVLQNISEDYEHQTLKGRISIVIGTTALALKCYRAERGRYPEKLSDLVPEYLDKLPVCPYTGGAVSYESDARIFTLGLGRGGTPPRHTLTSKAKY